MNVLPVSRRSLVLQCLTEGNSIRATSRLTGASKTTVLKFVAEFGEFSEHYQDKHLRNLPCTNIQMDEIWSFCGCKEKNRETAKNPQQGDVWTWTSMCRDTKLMPSWIVGERSQQAANDLAEDLAKRLLNRPQIATDGHRSYQQAIVRAFDDRADYGKVTKNYEKSKGGYEIVVSVDRTAVLGNPEHSKICTSHVERANLSMRMGMRRFTRLTNAFSKKMENHSAQIAIYFFVYNFIKKHSAIKTAPAVAAGIMDKPMTFEEAIGLFDEFRKELYAPKRPIRYKKRREMPRTHTPQTPLVPWYIDPESGGPNPPAHLRKPGVLYKGEGHKS